MKEQFSSDLLGQCIFLAGPTASGKTDVAIKLAQQIEASRKKHVEIVSMDSMCVYRGMDIGTAKPSLKLQRRIPHHQIDIIDPHEDYSVVDYIQDARAVCETIIGNGGVPLFVGGTGLYLRAVLRGVFQGPPADQGIRDRYQRQADEAAAKGDHFFLMRQLERVDVDATLRLHPNDHRRLIRALEVFELTGTPLSKLQKQPVLPDEQRPPNVFWLDPPREWLHERINRRVEIMIDDGLIQEVKTLNDLENPLSHTARQGLGYKEIIDVLDEHDELTDELLASITETIQTRTRQFAKRQYTMFRNTEECRDVGLEATQSAAEVAQQVLELCTIENAQ